MVAEEITNNNDQAEEFGNRIMDAARTGGKDGFVIKLGRKTGKSSIDPLTGEKESQMVYDEERIYHKHSMSAQDYKRYQDVKKQLALEKDDDKRIDLTLRLYEYLALKFLGMSHEEFVIADFDDVVVAALACEALFGSGGGSSTTTTTNVQSPSQQQRVTRVVPVPKLKPKSTTGNYYKSPDEE